MKKIVVVFCVFYCTAALWAEKGDISFSAGAAYTNYFLQAQLDPSVENLSAAWAQMNSGTVREKNNAAALAVDLRLYYFYTMMQLAFPGKDFSDVTKAGNSHGFLLNPGTYILDLQSGAGYTFFKKKAVSIFVGAGVGFNSVKSIVKISGKDYVCADNLMGAGTNILFSFYPISFLGFYAGVADTVYFLPLRMLRSLDNVEAEKALMKRIIANSFNFKAGIVIRL